MNLIEIVPAHSLEHKLEIRRMGAEVIPRDKSWQVILLVAALVLFDAVLFVRWWVCGDVGNPTRFLR